TTAVSSTKQQSGYASSAAITSTSAPHATSAARYAACWSRARATSIAGSGAAAASARAKLAGTCRVIARIMVATLRQMQRGAYLGTPSPGPFHCLGCQTYVTGTPSGHCPRGGYLPPRAAQLPESRRSRRLPLLLAV